MIVPSFCLKESDGFYSAAIVFDRDGSIAGIQRKHGITRDLGFFEADYFSPSLQGFQAIRTSIGKIGVVMCYDRHFPESFRRLSEQEVAIVIVPVANTLDEDLEFFEWEIRTAAKHTCTPIIMINRSGREGPTTFAGGSLAVDQHGAISAKLSLTAEQLTFDLDQEVVGVERGTSSYVQLYRKNRRVLLGG